MVPKTTTPAKKTEAAPATSSTIAAPTPAAGSVGPSAAAVAAATGAAAGPDGLPPLTNVTDNTTADNLPQQAAVNGTGTVEVAYLF